MKYLMFSRRGGTDVPIIFPDVVDHSEMLVAIKNQFPGWTPVSAGRIFGLHVNGAAGGSVTTKIPSREEDTDIINRWGEF